MVRSTLLIAALPLALALYIPHDSIGVAFGQEPDQLVDATIEIPTRGKHDKPHKFGKGHGGRAPSSHGKSGNKLRGSHPPPPPPPHGIKGFFGGLFGGEKKPCHHSEDHRESFDAEDKFVGVSADHESAIPDKYIIVFEDNVDPSAMVSHFAWVSETHDEHLTEFIAAGNDHPIVGAHAEGQAGLTKTYDLGSFKGYAGHFLPGTIELIKSSPLVKHIERDTIVHHMSPQVESGAPWGLARVSHRKGLSLGTFNKYLYDKEGGEGVTSYIVDTGIYVDHNDFEGRATWGKTVPANDVDKDAHGHGSHCAGTIAGKKYGVAKKANVVAVKVLGSDGSGTMSDVIGGVEYVVASHKKEQAANSKHKGSTANMSLGGGKSLSLELAVNAAVNNGVHFAVAAGNENQDACNVSPSGASEPVTVGASSVSDERAYFSNWGKCVDIFAPGVNVLSIGITGPDSTQIMSGTSMASPHIAGLLTYFLSLQPDHDSGYASKAAITPRQLKKNLISFGTPDVLEGLDSASPNILAFNGAGEDLSAFWSAAAETEETEETKSETKSETYEFSLKDIEDVIKEEFNEIVGYSHGLISDLKDVVNVAF